MNRTPALWAWWSRLGAMFCLQNFLLLQGQQPGALDPSFDPGTGVARNGSATVAALQLQAGKAVIAGSFISFNGTPRHRLARLGTDGKLDPTFEPGSGAEWDVFSLALQPDGKVVVGGAFQAVNGIPRMRIARLSVDGRVDMSFDPGAGADWDVVAVALQPDGKVLIGGGFGAVNGADRSALARLDPDGKLDTSFIPVLGDDVWIEDVSLRRERILAVGYVIGTNNMVTNRVFALTSTGLPDPTFRTNVSADQAVLALSTQADGKIIIGGAFSRVNGTPRNRIARLNEDGSLDDTFNPGTGANGDVLSLGLQPDDKIIIGGSFTQFNGVPKSSVARLHPDGTLDASFNTGAGVEGAIHALVVQPDGRVVIGGAFTAVDGVPRNGIARLQGDTGPVAPLRLLDPQLNATGFSVAVDTAAGTSYVLEHSEAVMGPWTALPAVAGDGSRKTLTAPSSSTPQQFYRVRIQ